MRVLCVEIEMIFKLFVRGVIMFYFINFDTPTKSENYDKGVLFERLCKDLLDASGYNDIEMRVKANKQKSNSCQQNYFLPVLIESFDNKRLMKVVFTNKYPPIHYLNKISKGP